MEAFPWLMWMHSNVTGMSVRNSAGSVQRRTSWLSGPCRGEGSHQIHDLRASRVRRFHSGMNAHFAAWREKSSAMLGQLQTGCHPKEIIAGCPKTCSPITQVKPLIDQYDVYQHLMDYWEETMQDDCYLISADGWKAKTYRIIEKDKKGKEKDRGWTCDLVPKDPYRGPLLRQRAGGYR